MTDDSQILHFSFNSNNISIWDGVARILQHQIETISWTWNLKSFSSILLRGLRGDWLHDPISEWENWEEYLKMAKIVEIAVVNDTGKRGVKDIDDYANKAQDGDKRPIMVLISNLHRSIIPDFQKEQNGK